jgi:hydroxybutyrate-dimer hydrolase
MNAVAGFRVCALAIAEIFALLQPCGGTDKVALAQLPAGVTQHSVTIYPATTVGMGVNASEQDLLTAGLGRSGLGSLSAPTYADAANPTVAELRRNAIYANYRAILDSSANGGYGRLYGPNIDLAGVDQLGEGLVPGKEYSASVDDGSGRKRVAMVVQIPSRFDPNNPCIVAGPSSGSRGIYGAIATAGEWGLKKGCAVALTDTGKGMGLYDPTDDSVNRIDGTRASRSVAGSLTHFAANLSDAERQSFNAAFPNRLALKHVHSQVNPEKDWGQDTLVAVRYALYALNQEYGKQAPTGEHEALFTPDNTLVIAGSVSNGGAAVLRAAEQDTDGLIDGVVASEPSAQPRTTTGYGVQFGGNSVPIFGKPLIDYITYANLYQPCAVLAPTAVITELSPYNMMVVTPSMTLRAANRCAALSARGLVSGGSMAVQAADALAKLRAYGWSSEHDTMHNSHYGLGNAPVVAMMYTNAFGRFSITDNLCGMSLAAVNVPGDIVPTVAEAKTSSFATGNGAANGIPASVIYNASVGGAKLWTFAISPTSGQADFALDAAICQRAVVTGEDPVTGAALTATSMPTLAQSQAVRAGMAEVLLNGNLRGKPTLIVAGRSDALVPVNHSSRAYAAYIEVTNAQHFDVFLSLPGFDTRFVPLHGYFFAAMNAMYAKLKDGTSLPPSQVVRTTPRGGLQGAAPALQAAQVPSIKAAPSAGDAIDFSGTTIRVPQ